MASYCETVCIRQSIEWCDQSFPVTLTDPNLYFKVMIFSTSSNAKMVQDSRVLTKLQWQSEGLKYQMVPFSLILNDSWAYDTIMRYDIVYSTCRKSWRIASFSLSALKTTWFDLWCRYLLTIHRHLFRSLLLVKPEVGQIIVLWFVYCLF